MTLRHIVLGGGGFLGRHLVRDLAEHGRSVTPVDRSFCEGDASPPSSRVLCDLGELDSDALARLIDGCDVVHHLAWSTVPATAQRDAASDLADNVGLTIRVLEAVAHTGARLLFASSGGTVYGATDVQPIPETEPLRPISAYGAGKAAAEMYIGAFRASHGIDVRIARLSNPFGAGQAREKPQGVVSRFVADALAGRPIEIWGDGDVVRDFLHVSDAVAGLRTLATASADQLGGFHVFNFGGGSGTSVNQLVRILERAMNRRLPVSRKPGRLFDVPRNMLDVERAGALLGWRPSADFERAVQAMTQDFLTDPAAIYSRPLAVVTGADAA